MTIRIMGWFVRVLCGQILSRVPFGVMGNIGKSGGRNRGINHDWERVELDGVDAII